jgi:hypothetical protein
MFLANLFDPRLNLLPEYRGANVYWLSHDNYLAAKALSASHPKMAQSIMVVIDHESPFSPGRIGLIFGEGDKAWPFRESQLVDVRHVGTNTIRTEIEPGLVFTDWSEYADLDLLACIVEEHRGNESAAHQHFEDAMRLWDGKGFLDEAARQIGAIQPTSSAWRCLPPATCHRPQNCLKVFLIEF